jgi:pectinesterase
VRGRRHEEHLKLNTTGTIGKLYPPCGHCSGNGGPRKENISNTKLAKANSRVAGASSAAVVMRTYFTGSFIQGDTDFIFGHGAAVFNASTIQYTPARKGSNASDVFIPSTRPGSSDGFLVTGGTLNSPGDARSNTNPLGRAWDESRDSLANSANGSPPNERLHVFAEPVL